MGAVTIELRLGGRYQQFSTDALRIVLGKGGSCNLRVPLAFLEERHLEIDRRSGLLRIRTLSPTTRAYLGHEPVGEQWRLIGSDALVEIPSPAGLMTIGLSVNSTNGVVTPLIAEDEAEVEVGVWAEATLASPEGEVEPTPPKSIPELPLPKPKGPSQRPNKLRNAVFLLLVVMALAVGTAAGWNEYGRWRAGTAARQQMLTYQALVENAREQMRQGKYAAGRAAVLEAQQIAQRQGWEDALAETRELMERPEIQFGALGYVQMEGRWVEPAVANLWQEAKARNDPRIAEYLQTARDRSRESKLEEARSACVEAIALMEAFPAPARPHPMLRQAQTLAKDVDNQLVAKDMVAKGLVLYNGRWMSKEEQFRARQVDQGMVEYKGQWLTKDAAFAQQQADKGLVLHEGRWMTPEEKLQAQGYEQFEGRWVSAQERQEILAQRQARKQEADRLARERQADEELTRQQRQAYEQSQRFFRIWLQQKGRTGTLAFGPLIGVQTRTRPDGWIILRAPYQLTESSGRQVSSRYVCQLRQNPDGSWECQQVGDPNVL